MEQQYVKLDVIRGQMFYGYAYVRQQNNNHRLTAFVPGQPG